MAFFFKEDIIKNHRFYGFLYRLFILLRAFFVIAVCLFVGNYLSDFLKGSNLIVIPGSILGLLFLFLLLMLKVVSASWVKEGCQLLTRYMIVLFVPAALGIMETYPLLMDDWGTIFIGSIGSTVMVLVLTAYLTEWMMRRHHRNEEDHPERKSS